MNWHFGHQTLNKFLIYCCLLFSIIKCWQDSENVVLKQLMWGNYLFIPPPYIHMKCVLWSLAVGAIQRAYFRAQLGIIYLKIKYIYVKTHCFLTFNAILALNPKSGLSEVTFYMWALIYPFSPCWNPHLLILSHRRSAVFSP